MAKNKKTKSKVAVKCQCSRCDQIAHAQEGTVHHYCKGIHPSIIAMLPNSMKDLTNPTKKGTWKVFVEPVKSEPIETPAQEVA